MVAEFSQPRSRWEGPGESGAVILRRYIEAETETLQGILAVYLHRAWAMSQEEAQELAEEVLAEVVTIALAKATEFDPRRNPRAWLLGIGSRVVLRRRDALFTQRRREAGPPPGAPTESSLDDQLFDRLAALSSPDVALTVEQADAVDRLLAPLTPDARQVVRLGIIAGLQGEALALVLQCKPGTARVRLFRAVRQLRMAWGRTMGDYAEGSQA